MGLLRGIFPNILLADLHLCLPDHAPDSGDCACLSDQEGEASRLEGLQVHCLHSLHLKHHTGDPGTGYIWPEDVYKHRCGDICGWNNHTRYHYSWSDLYS